MPKQVPVDFALALISAVKKRDLLYNTKSRDYKNRVYTQKAWLEVSNEVQRSVAECKVTWGTFRGSYNRILGTLKQTAYDGPRHRPPRWYLFDHMSFLSDHVAHKDVLGNYVRMVSKLGASPSSNQPSHDFQPSSPSPSSNEPTHDFQPSSPSPSSNQPSHDFQPSSPSSNEPTHDFQPPSPSLNHPTHDFQPSSPPPLHSPSSSQSQSPQPATPGLSSTSPQPSSHKPHFIPLYSPQGATVPSPGWSRKRKAEELDVEDSWSAIGEDNKDNIILNAKSAKEPDPVETFLKSLAPFVNRLSRKRQYHYMEQTTKHLMLMLGEEEEGFL